MARARGRIVLQSPCSAAQLLCIHSLRHQRVLCQSHHDQISKPLYPVILACPLTSHFLPTQLPPMVPKLCTGAGEATFLKFLNKHNGLTSVNCYMVNFSFPIYINKHSNILVVPFLHSGKSCCQTCYQSSTLALGLPGSWQTLPHNQHGLCISIALMGYFEKVSCTKALEYLRVSPSSCMI